MKKLCGVHRYYYSGSVCPLCANEKYEKILERCEKDKVEKDEITDDMLSKLKDKFTSK